MFEVSNQDRDERRVGEEEEEEKRGLGDIHNTSPRGVTLP